MPKKPNFAEEYHVTRQIYYYSGEYAVEISRGRDGCGPDALMPHWEAEGYYTDPREAAEAAIKVHQLWFDLWCKERTGDEDTQIIVTVSNTGFHGIEGEDMSYEEIRKWAQQEYSNLVKCEQCGELVTDKEHYTMEGEEDVFYCSENCAENAYWEWMNEITQEEEDEQVIDNQRLLLVKE